MAFYGIFLGHEHRESVGERHLCRGERMVVRKGVLDHVQAVRTQLAEKALRVADAGHGVHTLSVERRERSSRALVQTHDLRSFELHAERHARQQRCERAACHGAIHHYRIHLAQPRCWLAQRTGRQQTAVADTARAVDHHDLAIAREPAARLRQVDAVVVNGVMTRGSLAPLLPGVVLGMQLEATEVVSLDERSRQPLASFTGQRVHAVAGIGNPQRFFAELRAHDLEVIEHACPDHHPVTAAHVAFADTLPVLMTEKDAVKFDSSANPQLWYVPVTAQLTAPDAQELLMRVLAKVRGTATAGGLP